MPYYGAEAAVEAVREFLVAGTHDGPTSPAATYAAQLADLRTALGITTAALPDIAQTETFWSRGAAAERTPHMLITWDGAGAEALPPTGRSYDHRVIVDVFIVEADISGDETQVGLAGARYADALRVMLHRRDRGEEGATLNNGGTGAARGRVVHCAVERQIAATVEGAPPNMLLRTELRVRMSEVY